MKLIKLFYILLIGLLLIVPSLAYEDKLLINVTTLPEWYLIDYGVGNAAIVTNYSLATPYDQDALQHWILWGSNDGIYFVNLDERTNESFVHDIAQNYTITTSAPYRDYVLYLKEGFNFTAHDINLSLFSSYVTPSAFIMTNVYNPPSSTTFDINAFLGKWLIVFISIVLIITGMRIPLSAIAGVGLNLINLGTNYAKYTELEIIALAVMTIIGIFVFAGMMKRSA
jgi:hypothetical protein